MRCQDRALFVHGANVGPTGAPNGPVSRQTDANVALMLDSFATDAVEPSERGVLARVGTFVLDVECSERDASQVGDGSTIHCQVETDDGEFHLVGFANVGRRDLYRALRRVSGIGRRSALVVLDCGEEVDILRAVAGKDASFFRSVPGVGPRRIEAIIEELEKRFRGTLPSPVPVRVADWITARDAIVDRHPDLDEADAVVSRAAAEGMDAERLVAAVLAQPV